MTLLDTKTIMLFQKRSFVKQLSYYEQSLCKHSISFGESFDSFFENYTKGDLLVIQTPEEKNPIPMNMIKKTFLSFFLEKKIFYIQKIIEEGGCLVVDKSLNPLLSPNIFMHPKEANVLLKDNELSIDINNIYSYKKELERFIAVSHSFEPFIWFESEPIFKSDTFRQLFNDTLSVLLSVLESSFHTKTYIQDQNIDQHGIFNLLKMYQFLTVNKDVKITCDPNLILDNFLTINNFLDEETQYSMSSLNYPVHLEETAPRLEYDSDTEQSTQVQLLDTSFYFPQLNLINKNIKDSYNFQSYLQDKLYSEIFLLQTLENAFKKTNDKSTLWTDNDIHIFLDLISNTTKYAEPIRNFLDKKFTDSHLIFNFLTHKASSVYPDITVQFHQRFYDSFKKNNQLAFEYIRFIKNPQYAFSLISQEHNKRKEFSINEISINKEGISIHNDTIQIKIDIKEYSAFLDNYNIYKFLGDKNTNVDYNLIDPLLKLNNFSLCLIEEPDQDTRILQFSFPLELTTNLIEQRFFQITDIIDRESSDSFLRKDKVYTSITDALLKFDRELSLLSVLNGKEKEQKNKPIQMKKKI